MPMENQISSSRPVDDPIIRDFVVSLRTQMGPRLRQVFLFGSRARGDAKEDSDYDMLVIVDQRTLELRNKILEIEARLMDRYGALVATVLQSEEEWEQAQGLPLARNVAREGMAL